MPTHDSKTTQTPASRASQDKPAVKKAATPKKKKEKKPDIDLTRGVTETVKEYEEEDGPTTRKTYEYGTQTYNLETAQDEGMGEWVNPDEKEVDRLKVKQNQSRSVMELSHVGHYKTKPTITLDGKAKPKPEDLYYKDDDGLPVTHTQGTIDKPITYKTLIPNTLFIENKTHVEDVRQGNIGDCYFLATVLQVVNQQPKKFLDLMKISGDTVTTTLYRKSGSKWVPTTIQTKYGVATKKEKDSDEIETVGSSFRIAYHPKTSKWQAIIPQNSKTLKVGRKDYYEAALWVNCLEQAYAAFAQKYGQYGTGHNDTSRDVNKKGERYENTIDGGWARHCVTMFYGNDTQERTKRMTSTKIDNNAGIHTEAETNDILIDQNKNILKDLQAFAKAQNGHGENLIFCTSSITKEKAASRLKTHAQATRIELSDYLNNGQVSYGTQPYRDLKEAEILLTDIVSILRRYDPEDENETIRDRLHNITIDLANNEAFQNAKLKSTNNVMRSLGNVVEDVNDNENRNIMTLHAYNLSKVFLKNSENKIINNLPYDELKTQLDLDKSIVRMQNPHGTHKSSQPGNYAEKDEGGTFDMPLRAFLNTSDRLEFVKVKNTNRILL